MTAHTPADDAGDYAALLERVDFLVAENRRQASGWAADKVRANEARAEADRLRAEVERLRKYAPSAEVEALLARSSLGTDEAEAARDSVSPDAGRLVVRLSEVMAERDNLRVTLGAVAARCDDLMADIHAAGDWRLGTEFTVGLIRAILAADPVSLADVRDGSES